MREKLIECAIRELLLDIAKRMEKWSRITNQTSQPRISYAGQHITSVITGFKGSLSGARGDDLILDGDSAEIKSSIRAFQLSKCIDCKSRFSNIYINCPYCGSDNVKLNEDSKWLISLPEEFKKSFYTNNRIINDKKKRIDLLKDLFLRNLIKPKYYFLFLVDFPENNEIITIYKRGVEIKRRQIIRILLYRIESLSPGFVFCMLDYIYNIIPSQNKGAPFNLWPFQFKFFLMKPKIIYGAVVNYDTDEFIVSYRSKPLDELSYDELECLSKYISSQQAFNTIDEKFLYSLKEKCKFLNSIDIIALGFYLPKLKNFLSDLYELFSKFEEIYNEEYITSIKEVLKSLK